MTISATASFSGPAMDVPRARPARGRHWAVLALSLAAAAAGVTWGLSRLGTAVPTVERASVWVDSVKRGELLREVRGPGTLVPEQIRFVSAAWPARVESIRLRPGTAVEADTILLTLANPELELQALEAERQLASAAAALVELTTQGRSQHLAALAALETLKFEADDARRQAEANRSLGARGMVSGNEVQRGEGKRGELDRRIALEEQRQKVATEGLASQLSAQRAQLGRLNAVAEFRRNQVDGLQVRAGAPGVLQELPLQPGQWVSTGTLLAKVAQPDRLKAEILIAQAQARDVQVGQGARIDTRQGVVQGHVTRVDPSVQAGTVKVELAFDGPLPKGCRPDLSVEGSIELERLPDVLYVGRPALNVSEGTLQLFRLTDGGRGALRVPVLLGRGSVGAVEVKQGLSEGDEVILSDMTQFDAQERVALK